MNISTTIMKRFFISLIQVYEFPHFDYCVMLVMRRSPHEEISNLSNMRRFPHEEISSFPWLSLGHLVIFWKHMNFDWWLLVWIRHWKYPGPVNFVMVKFKISQVIEGAQLRQTVQEAGTNKRKRLGELSPYCKVSLF